MACSKSICLPGPNWELWFGHELLPLKWVDSCFLLNDIEMQPLHMCILISTKPIPTVVFLIWSAQTWGIFESQINWLSLHDVMVLMSTLAVRF